MYICVCNAVTGREIRHAVELGCDSYRKVHYELSVGACCGKCKKDAKRAIKEHKSEMRALEADFGMAI